MLYQFDSPLKKTVDRRPHASFFMEDAASAPDPNGRHDVQ
jgi:hypothetical protein